MSYEAGTEYAEDGLLKPDAIYEEASFAEVGKRDGWLAALLLFSLIFGPRTAPLGLLPPVRFADIIIVCLVLSRWIKSNWLYGGFVFSYRNRLFSWFMLAMTFLLLFSTMINIAAGRYQFFIKDFYQPVVFIRMIFVAAITASFYFGEKQVKQFAKGVLIISLMSVILAFIQKFRYWYVSGFVERFYGIEWTRLEEIGTGVRVVGTFGNPNHFGLCLVVLAAVSLAIVINMKGLIRLLAAGTFVSLGAAVLITTASRTALIAFLMITAISLLLSLRGRAVIPVLVLTMLMIGMFIFVRAYADVLPLNPRVKSIIGFGGQESIGSPLQDRYVMWEESMRKAKESIVFGVGISKMTYQTTDNGYIIMLLRTGIIGLSIYISMLVALFIRGIKALHIEKKPFQRTVLLMSVIVLINHMIFELTGDFFWSVQYCAIFAAFMGLLCGLSRQALDKNYYQGEDYYGGVDEEEIAV
jgi:O-antigen ligase